MRETYGYDEFGQDLYRNPGQIQPFGYTGYQSDRIAETYYAQAREYRAELGRFAGWISSRDLQRHRIKILSPDSLKYKNAGGILIKIGESFRIDVKVGPEVTKLLHMHLITDYHIPIGILLSSLFPGLKHGLRGEEVEMCGQ